MARDLLCQWLSLPSHPWPPNHYALLELELGQGNGEEIEQRVLERMEKLRHYQLMHPEAVTEGMNLLAQAMIELTDTNVRAEYDRGLGIPPETVSPVEEEQSEQTPESNDLEPPAPPREITWRKWAPPPPLPPAPGEVADEPSAEPIVLSELEEEAAREEEPSLSVPRALLDNEPPRISKTDGDPARERHRALYRRIVRARRVLRIWETLGAYLEDSAKTFTQRTQTIAFMNVLGDLRPLLSTIENRVGKPNEPGHLIAALARQQLVVDMFRSLLPSQREALLQDCRSANSILLEHYQSMRSEVRQLTHKNFRRRVVNPAFRHLSVHPEWLFLLLGIAALAIAFVRSLPN